jgi:hypothetical protein
VPADTPGRARNARAVRRESKERIITERKAGVQQQARRRPPRHRAARAGAAAVDVGAISWLPATLDIRPLRLYPEPGVDLGTHETIVYARDDGERVSM